MTFIDNKFLRPIMFMERSRKMKLFNKFSKKQKITFISVLFILIISTVYLIWQKNNQLLTFVKDPILEINHEFDYQKIIKNIKNVQTSDIKVDTSKLKNDKIGSYPVTYIYQGKKFTVNINVVDKTKPKFEINNIEIDTGMDVDPTMLVDNIVDETKTTISFKDAYNFSKKGKVKVTVIVSDESNNKSTKHATVTVLSKDTTKPTISGLNDLTVTLNGKVDYLAGVKGNDNRDPHPQLTIDNKKVRLDKLGDYIVTYTCKDRSGNKIVAKRKVSVVEKKEIGVYAQTEEKVIYLTFDDGPSKNTKRILDILDKYHAKATFFVTGTNQNYNYLIKEAYQRGHTIGLHTYSHDYKTVYTSVTAYFNDLERVGNMVKNEIGFIPKYIRFPGGASNTISRKYCPGIMSILANEVIDRGYQFYDWNYGTGDAGGNNIPVNQIIATATAGNANNQVILAHDTDAKNTTVDALPAIIEHYQALGYSFKSIDDNSYVPHHHINN